MKIARSGRFGTILASGSIRPGAMIQIQDDGSAREASSISFTDVWGFYDGPGVSSGGFIDATRDAAWVRCSGDAKMGDVVFVAGPFDVQTTNNGIAAGMVVGKLNGGVFVKPLDESKLTRSFVLYNDILGDVSNASGVSALTNEALISGSPVTIPWFRHDQDDTITFVFQLPHSVKPNSDLHFHLHAIPMGSVGGNVLFRWKYAVVPIDSSIPAYASWTTADVVWPITAAMKQKNTLLNGFVISGVNFCESSIVIVEISRLGSDVRDTYTSNKNYATLQANLGILYGDMHYVSNKQGTATHGCTG